MAATSSWQPRRLSSDFCSLSLPLAARGAPPCITIMGGDLASRRNLLGHSYAELSKEFDSRIKGTPGFRHSSLPPQQKKAMLGITSTVNIPPPITTDLCYSAELESQVPDRKRTSN